MGTTRMFRTVGLLAALPLVIVACGPGAATTTSPTAVATPSPVGTTAPTTSPTAVATSSPVATTVKVTLQEWAVGTDVGTAPAGALTFAVTNKGPDDVHEFVVIKTDLSLVALPTDATGAVDEAGGGVRAVGEIEDVAVGTSSELKVTLEPGAYVLICNIYDATEKEAHYKKGMRTAFTVTP